MTAGEGGLLARIAAIQGHVGIALASSVASYLNLWLLWRGVRRDSIYTHGQVHAAEWRTHLRRTAVACLVLVATVLVGAILWPDWTQARIAERVCSIWLRSFRYAQRLRLCRRAL